MRKLGFKILFKLFGSVYDNNGEVLYFPFQNRQNGIFFKNSRSVAKTKSLHLFLQKYINKLQNEVYRFCIF